MNIWNSKTNTIEESFNLPVGRIAANVGFLVEQSINPEHVLIAATALKNSGQDVTVASQAGLMVKAQELGLAFADWSELKPF